MKARQSDGTLISYIHSLVATSFFYSLLILGGVIGKHDLLFRVRVTPCLCLELLAKLQLGSVGFCICIYPTIPFRMDENTGLLLKALGLERVASNTGYAVSLAARV